MVWRDELVDQITGHVHHDFELPNDLSAYDDISQLNLTIGDMLERIASNLADFKDPPFTYPRLLELSRLENVDSPKNKDQRRNRGIAYLRSALDLTCVFESNKVFEDFDQILDALPAPSIQLEPLPWAEGSDLGALSASAPALREALSSLNALDKSPLEESLLSESLLNDSLLSDSLLSESLSDSLNEFIALNQSLSSVELLNSVEFVEDEDLMDLN